jgi:hypothetical protein
VRESGLGGNYAVARVPRGVGCGVRAAVSMGFFSLGAFYLAPQLDAGTLLTPGARLQLDAGQWFLWNPCRDRATGAFFYCSIMTDILLIVGPAYMCYNLVHETSRAVPHGSTNPESEKPGRKD